jgi:hypothetical protein
MRAVSFGAGLARHVAGVGAQAILLVAILAALALLLSPLYTPANWIAGTDDAAAGRLGTINVSFGDGAARLAEEDAGSIFTADGCGFRANSSDYYMVVHGPTLYSSELGYWVDAFPVGRDGCGSSTVSWAGSGVAGDFDVWVVRSPSGNPWQAQPASNTVTITITNP